MIDVEEEKDERERNESVVKERKGDTGRSKEK